MNTQYSLSRTLRSALTGLALTACLLIASPSQAQGQQPQITDIEFATGNPIDGQLSAPGVPIFASDLNDNRNLQIIMHYTPNEESSYKVNIGFIIRDEKGKMMRDPLNPESNYSIYWDQRTVNASGLMKGYVTLRLMPGTYSCQVLCDDMLLTNKTLEIHRKPGEASYLNVNDETTLMINIPAEGGRNVLKVNTDAKHFNLIRNTANIDQRSRIIEQADAVVVETRPNYTHQTIETHLTIEADGLSVPVTFIQISANHFSSSAWTAPLNNMINVGADRTRHTAYKGESVDLKDHYVVMHWEQPVEMWFFGRVGKKNDERLQGIYLTGNLDENCIFDYTSVFVGKFAKNKMYDGACYDRLGNLIYDGVFKDNKPVAAVPEQTAFYPTDVNIDRRFDYIEEEKGAIYLGEILNGKKDGFGIYVWRNGDCWLGTWKDDVSVEGCFIENSGFGAKRNRFEEN